MLREVLLLNNEILLCTFWEDDTSEDLQVDEDPAMGNWRKVVTGNNNSEGEGTEAQLSLA